MRRCQLHMSRRSECLRLGNGHYCCCGWTMKGFLCNYVSRQEKALLVQRQMVPKRGKGERLRTYQSKPKTKTKKGKEKELTNPNLRLPQSLPLRSEQELQSIACTLQQKGEMPKIKRRRTHLKCKSLDTEDGKDHIGKDGTNPEDLGSRSTLDTEP